MCAGLKVDAVSDLHFECPQNDGPPDTITTIIGYHVGFFDSVFTSKLSYMRRV